MAKFTIHAEGEDLAAVIQAAVTQAQQLVKDNQAVAALDKKFDKSEEAKPEVASAKIILSRLPAGFKSAPRLTEARAKEVLTNFKFTNPVIGQGTYSAMLLDSSTAVWVKTPLGEVRLSEPSGTHAGSINFTKIEPQLSLPGMVVVEAEIYDEGRCLALLPLDHCFEACPIIKVERRTFAKDISFCEFTSSSSDPEQEIYVSHKKGDTITMHILREGEGTVDYLYYDTPDAKARLVCSIDLAYFTGFQVRGTVYVGNWIKVKFKQSRTLYEAKNPKNHSNPDTLEKELKGTTIEVRHNKDEIIDILVVTVTGHPSSPEEPSVDYTYDNAALGSNMYVRGVSFATFEIVPED